MIGTLTASSKLNRPHFLYKGIYTEIISVIFLHQAKCAVMEIRGQGGELIAKLINQDGSPFYVKKGTTLQSGHVIDEITTTYVRAEKAGAKDYLYFAAGGILPLEPQKSELEANLKDELKKKADGKKDETPKRDFIASEEVPGMGRDMIVR